MSTTREPVFRHQRDYAKRAEFRAANLARCPELWPNDKPEDNPGTQMYKEAYEWARRFIKPNAKELLERLAKERSKALNETLAVARIHVAAEHSSVYRESLSELFQLSESELDEQESIAKRRSAGLKGEK